MNIGTQDTSASLTATGTTQATALLLFNGLNFIGTVASGTGVLLFPGDVGTSQTVYNAGANALKVYPTSGAKINGLTTNGAMLLAPNTAVHFWNVTSTQTVGILSA